MTKRRIIEIDRIQNKNQHHVDPAPFKGVPVQMSELIRNLSNYGKNRYAMGMLKSIKILDRLIEDLRPFSAVTPELDEFIASAHAEATTIHNEVNRILREVDENV